MGSQKLQVSLLNFKEICRTCSCRGDLIPIFSEESDSNQVENIPEMLLSIANVEAVENDKLPQQICKKCYNKLNQAFEFRKLCTHNDKKLQSLANSEFVPVVIESIHPLDEESTFTVKSEKSNEMNVEEEIGHEEQGIEEYYSYMISDEQQVEDVEVINEDDIEAGTVIQILSPSQLTEDMLSKYEIEDFDNSTKKYCCYLCGNRFSLQKSLSIHIGYQHPDLKLEKGVKFTYDCQICGKKFNVQKYLEMHLESQHSNTGDEQENQNSDNEFEYKCDICGEKFNDENELLNHTELKHPEYEIHSEEEKEEPVVDDDNQANLIINICEVCGQEFKNEKYLVLHMNNEHSEHTVKLETNQKYDNTVCKICQRQFDSSWKCREHEIQHVLKTRIEYSKNGDILHICSLCSRSFPSKHGLSIHQAFHTNRKRDVIIEKPYDCLTCGKSFISAKAMRNHKKTHGNKTYPCTVCNKVFTIKARLQIHLRTHTGEKPYSCPDCGKRFGNTTSLRIHDLIHSGARPHYCKICNRRFKQHSHLKNHLLTHSGQRPFQCPVCGKTFVFKGNLTVHMRVHSGETPYICPKCGRGFYDSSRMKKHYKTHDKLYSYYNEKTQINN